MLIELKGNNYYSKVFKRVNYKLQNNTFWVVITLSTAEAEYIVAGLYCARILWMKQTLSDSDLSFEHVPIKCDSTSVISISDYYSKSAIW